MTYFDLKELRKQIKDQELEIKDVREKGCKSTQNITDMPRAGTTSDKPCDTACEIDTLERDLSRLKKRFDDGIDSIPDRYIRRAINKKLRTRWTWNHIAMWLGGGNTGDGVRKMCVRYKW